MTKRIIVSPRWLELLAQKMRNARISHVEITESGWVNTVKDAINRSEMNDGIEAELGEEEVRLVEMIISKRRG